MKISGAYTLHAGREQVWALIHNPTHLIRLIPGCEQLSETGPAEYRGQMQIPVAAMAGVYTTCVHLQESTEPFTTRFTGEMNGSAGALRGDAWFHLAEGEDETTSLLTYEGQGMITGPLSRMDGRIAESVARSLIGQGLANLDRYLQTMSEAVPLALDQPASASAATPSCAGKEAAVRRFLRLLVAQIKRLLGRRAR